MKTMNKTSKVVLARIRKNSYDIMYFCKNKNGEYLDKYETIASSKHQLKLELLLRNLEIDKYLGSNRETKTKKMMNYLFKLRTNEEEI